MYVLVPFDATDPKTRLDDVLAPDEREAFARAMLEDVLAAVRAAGETPTVVATADVEVDATVRVDDRPLTPCVNALFDDRLPNEAVAVVMADLALATPGALARLFEAAGDVALAPGRGGGTNALVNRHPDFRADYHGASYLDHLRAARAAGASVAEVDSFRLATDVDERADLTDVLVHGEGKSAAWLREAGFALSRSDGRVAVDRR